jgi:hypothetical protein
LLIGVHKDEFDLHRYIIHRWIHHYLVDRQIHRYRVQHRIHHHKIVVHGFRIHPLSRAGLLAGFVAVPRHFTRHNFAARRIMRSAKYRVTFSPAVADAVTGMPMPS